jgi:hypothetical protein
MILRPQPQMLDDGDSGAISGMIFDRGNLSPRRKPAPAPLCPPQISHDQARTRPYHVGVLTGSDLNYIVIRSVTMDIRIEIKIIRGWYGR